MKVTILLSALASMAIGVIAAADDFKIDVTHSVECERKSKVGDRLSMHYKGTLTSGKEFDSSYSRNSPFSFKLGAGQVIKGWDQGLLDMCIGDKRTLTIPPELGYGSRAMGPIPAGSTLIFETELVGIDGVAAPAKPAEPAEEPAEKPAAEKVAEKVASVASEAAEAAKTILSDTDEGHQEL